MKPMPLQLVCVIWGIRFRVSKETEDQPLHRVLREVLRHYTEYRDHVTKTGDHVIYRGNVGISFWDLHRGIKELSPRKREALFYNVILDWKQRDVAERMGITTVSVGQYVEQACLQLAEEYFADEYAKQKAESEAEDKETDVQKVRRGRAGNSGD